MIPLDTLFADHQGGHSDLQMDSFITIRSGGTLYGCFKQALRELAKRTRGLFDLYRQRDLLAIELDKPEDDPKAVVEMEFKRRNAPFLASSIDDTEREFRHFYGQAVSLRESLGIDDEHPLTPERRAALDAEFWEHRLRCQIATDLMTAGRPAGTTLALLQSLPAEARKRIVADCLAQPKVSELIDWFLNYSPPVPEPKAIPAEAVKGLLCCESSPSPKLSPPSYILEGNLSAEISTETDSWRAKNATGDAA